MARVRLGSKEALLERVTRSFPYIETDHEYIHEGNFFESSIDFTLATTESGLIVIHTPTELYLHYRNEKVSCSAGKVTIELYEGPTVTAATGDVITPFNHSRISTITSQSTVLKNPTVTDNGTKIAQSFLGGGTGQGQSRSGSETSSQNEWVLKRNTKYLIRVVNDSTGSNIVQVNPVWYEEGSA